MLLLALPAIFSPLGAQPAAPGATLAAVRARATLNCGISTGDPAWSQPDARGVWQGLASAARSGWRAA